MENYQDFVEINESITIPPYEKPGVYSFVIPNGPLYNGQWKLHIRLTIVSHEVYKDELIGKVAGWIEDKNNQDSQRAIFWGGCIECPFIGKGVEKGWLKENERRFLLAPYQWGKLSYVRPLPSDPPFNLKFKVQVKVSEEHLPNEAAPPKSSPCEVVCGISALAQSLGSLLTSGLLSDVTLRTKEGDVAAHRSILAARSDFFKAKFKPEWQEGDAVVDVSDVSLTVLKEMLKYMYSGSYGDNVSKVDLLVAADMYLVTDLCNEIKEKLEKNLESGNLIAPICDLLKTSAICNSTSLRAVILKYMKKHPEVWKTKEWKEFHIANRQMAAEATLDMINLPD